MPFRTLLISLIPILLCAAKPPVEWKQGKLLELNHSTRQRVVGANGTVATHERHIFTYSIDGGDKIYEAEEVSRKAPRVEVNADIQYTVSKDSMSVKDLDGATHKLKLLKTTRKP
jgi:hypothetical protein